MMVLSVPPRTARSLNSAYQGSGAAQFFLWGNQLQASSKGRGCPACVDGAANLLCPRKQGAAQKPPLPLSAVKMVDDRYFAPRELSGERRSSMPTTSNSIIHHRRSYDKERARIRWGCAYHRLQQWRFQAITLDRVVVSRTSANGSANRSIPSIDCELGLA
jgi:hypothetical protein